MKNKERQKGNEEESKILKEKRSMINNKTKIRDGMNFQCNVVK